MPISHSMIQTILELRNSQEAIWIDALCINQEDEQEKINAIGSMDLIYKSARLVVVVLEDIELSAIEVDLIRKHQEKNSGSGGKKARRDDEAVPIWRLLARIGSARWFKRAWCSHEFHLSRDAIFLVPHGGGCVTISLCTLQKILKLGACRLSGLQGLEQTLVKSCRELNLLLSSRFFNFGRLTQASPVLGISFMVLNLKFTKLSDKISIAINLCGLGSYFKGKAISPSHCRQILSTLALAAGDALALCCTGLNLHSDQSSLRWPHRSDLVHLDSGYPPKIEQAFKFESEWMIVDMLFLASWPIRPTKASRNNAKNFLITCLKEHRSILFAINPQWIYLNFNRERFFTQQMSVYLACAKDCGVKWMARALSIMGCDAVAKGLKGHEKEIHPQLWPVAKKFFLGNKREDFVVPKLLNSRRIPLLKFITFSLHHSTVVGDPKMTAAISIGSSHQRALVTIPKRANPQDEILLAVPAALASPRYSFIKRLWHLRRVGEGGLYQVIAKTYLWGCGIVKEQEGYVRLERNIRIVR